MGMLQSASHNLPHGSILKCRRRRRRNHGARINNQNAIDNRISNCKSISYDTVISLYKFEEWHLSRSPCLQSITATKCIGNTFEAYVPRVYHSSNFYTALEKSSFKTITWKPVLTLHTKGNQRRRQRRRRRYT